MDASGGSEQVGTAYSQEIQDSLSRLHGLLLGHTPPELSSNGSSNSHHPEESDPIRLLQYILVGPLQTSVDTLAEKVSVLEQHVYDPTLAKDIAALQAQVSDRSHIDALKNQLNQFSSLNIPNQIGHLTARVTTLEHQLHEPEELMQLLLPLLNDLIERKVVEAGDGFAKATAPVLDDMIRHKISQDKKSMSKALAPVLSTAIGYQVEESPGEFATVIGPEMNIAIKEQVRSNAASMIDALYPIIGSTIGKYIAEVLRTINEKLERSLSPEGIFRKIRARLRGVSEAELLLKEAAVFQVQAVFLIQRLSGLVITQAQPADSPPLETDLIGGMLTAIRGFVQEWLAQNGDLSELDRIAYGNSFICLEGAGHAYLAVVIHGEPPTGFLEKVRRVMRILVLDFGQVLESYEGNTWAVPPTMISLVSSLIPEPEPRPRSLRFLWILAALLIAGIAIPGVIGYHRRHQDKILLHQAEEALRNTPELAVYQVQVKIEHRKVKLEGKLPNTYLQQLAESTVQKSLPDQTVENAIIAVQTPYDPVQASAEITRLTHLLQKRSGVKITTEFEDGILRISGMVPDTSTISTISQAFAQVPGVQSVVTALQVPPPRLDIQIFFATNSAELKPEDDLKITQIYEFLQENPTYRLQIIGQSDVSGASWVNQELALARARSVRSALHNRGIPMERLQVLGYPPSSQVRWSDRRVRFEVLLPN